MTDKLEELLYGLLDRPIEGIDYHTNGFNSNPANGQKIGWGPAPAQCLLDELYKKVDIITE